MLPSSWFLLEAKQVVLLYVQAKEDGDKPGLEAMLQKVLQLYASRVLSKRSYAKKGVAMYIYSYNISIYINIIIVSYNCLLYISFVLLCKQSVACLFLYTA